MTLPTPCRILSPDMSTKPWQTGECEAAPLFSLETAIENERLRKIEQMIGAIGTQALKDHHSAAAVASNLSDAIRAPLMSLLEEFDQVIARVEALETGARDLGEE
jgi:hypothetical protein